MKPLTAKLSQEANTDQPSVQTEYYDDGYGAAGCIFVAKDTGRILLAHRNAEEDPKMGYVEEPDSWATWGGKIEHGESAKDSVVREVKEETGYDGEYKLAFLWTYEDKSKGFQYHNFMAIVPSEFVPQRNWENDRGKWVEWGEWPHPMHFGLQALLQHAGEKIHRVITLIKRKKAGIVREMDAPPAIVQPASTNATANYNITNAYVVATTLWGEARGEGEKGMQAVMNVIMNRAKGNFKRAKDIVLAPKQFSMWNSVTNAEETALAAAGKCRSDESWQKAIRIVDLAAEGKLPDITGGATFYFNPKKVHPSWANKMTKTVSIGKHDFYKPRKMVRKKVPEVIREMIESQDPYQVVLFKKGLVDDGVWEYELKSSKSYLRYRHEPDTKIFYLDNVGTPNEDDQDKGYAKAILETFFQLIKQYSGTLDPGTYTTLGMSYVKHVVERLAKQYGVRLVKGQDPIHESAVDKSKGKNKLSEAYGDPGDHVIFGGVFYPERVVANIVKSHNDYFGHTHEHGPTRWVYYQGMKTVFWYKYPPAVPEWEVIVKEWLEKRGYPVEWQTDKEQYHKLMVSLHKQGLLKEGVRLDYINKRIQALEKEWERIDGTATGFSRQQQIRVEIEKLRREKERWDKLWGSVNEQLLMEAITDEQAKAAVGFLKKMVIEGPFKGQVHLAGGPVRDMIMGKTPKDLDLSVVSDTIWGALKFTTWLANQMGNYKGPSAPPPTFAKHIRVDDYGCPKFSLIHNDPAIVRAIEVYDNYYAQYSNPVIFPKFGTAKLNLTGTFNGVDLTGVEVEAVSARKEIYETGNRKPIKVLPGTLEDDAKRRDFRCNSLLMDLTTDNIFDVTGKGIEDIKNRVLITTSDPEVIFREDPLRMMRAVRFMVQKGFNISPETEVNIKQNASWLRFISRERVRDEIDKILVTKDPGAAFRKMNELGLLQYVAPEFQQMIGMTQNVHHEHDVFDHTMAVLAKTNPELVRRRIALFHDIGKLVTREVTPTGVHFIGHEDKGPEIAEKIMMDLKYPKTDIDAVKLGISHHMKLKHGGDDAVNLSDKSLRKFKIAVGQYLEHILDVIHADNVAHASASAMPNQVAAVRKRLETLDIKEIDKPTLPITGNDLIAIGIKPGPVIGKMLSAVTDAWYENPLITKDQAMQIARQTYGKP